MLETLSKPLSLYDLTLEGVQIRDLLEANEGELTPELEARLDALMIAGPDRIEAAAMVVTHLEGAALVCEQEVLRLGARAKAFQDNAKRLKDRMAIALDLAFNGKIKTHRFTLWTQQSADHIAFDVAEGFTIDDVQHDSPGLVRVKKELDKRELADRFRDGRLLPPSIAFERSEGKRFVRIR